MVFKKILNRYKPKNFAIKVEGNSKIVPYFISIIIRNEIYGNFLSYFSCYYEGKLRFFHTFHTSTIVKISDYIIEKEEFYIVLFRIVI